MAADNTAALVVALSAQLTKFENDMKKAGDIADKTVSGIEDRFSKSNPVFSGSFLGNFLSNLTTKGLEAILKFANDLIDRFIELEKVSRLVGESMRDLFGVQEAAKSFKVPVEDSLASLKSLAILLDQMQRGEKNSLSKLFDVNPAALQGVNRDTLTLQQTLAIVADLVQNAKTNIQKIDLAKAAGQAETMVPFLERGGAAVTQLSKNAALVAPDLQKLADAAKTFDEAWRTALVNVKGYISEHLFEVLKTDLIDLIAILGGFVKFFSLFKGGFLDPTATINQLNQIKSALENFRNRATQIDESAGLNLTKPGAAASGGLRQGGTGTRDADRPLSNVPVTAEANTRDAFERETEKITKHIATLNADTAAVFQNNAAQAQLRAEFSLLNAARLAGANITQDQIDAYEKLRAQGIEPLVALTRLHIDLSEKQKTVLIAASEGARTATANFDAANSSLQKINSASQQLGSALSTAFADAIVEGKSLNDVLASLIKTLEKAVINAAFADIFSPQGGNKTSLFGSLFTGHAAGTNYAPGGWSWVGEKGPELVNLPRGSQVMPNDVATGFGGGGGSPIIFSPHIDARGADVAAVAKLAQIMAEQRRTFSRDVINAVIIARKGRHL